MDVFSPMTSGGHESAKPDATLVAPKIENPVPAPAPTPANPATKVAPHLRGLHGGGENLPRDRGGKQAKISGMKIQVKALHKTMALVCRRAICIPIYSVKPYHESGGSKKAWRN